VNYEDLDRVVRLASNLSRSLVARDVPLDFAKVEPKVEQGPARDAVRAFTGTIPDYATEVDGLLLSGVVEGGPASKAGLQEGDIIVRFGSRDIKNIYDYTYALEAVKVDEPLTVVFVRDGERIETTMTPTARP
jgi:S1-C subfamily serine protease